ncbi:MAG: SH3 domain-containing protein [Saprospiraceae bacterium]
MKIIVILYLILFCADFLLGQKIQVDSKVKFVIANGGLNLRSKPSKNSKKITNIPFGSTIEYVSEKYFGNDSIIVLQSDSEEKELIKGNWVKVDYQKMRGYVLDIYLNYEPSNKNRFNVKFSGDFVLLYPGCGCDKGNLHNPVEWKWFGYFRTGEGKYKV